MKITELELDVIKNGFGQNEYNDTGEPVWSWSIQSNCKIVAKEQISGVMGSLVKKGLAVTYNNEGGKNPDDDVAALTDEGKAILNEVHT